MPGLVLTPQERELIEPKDNDDEWASTKVYQDITLGQIENAFGGTCCAILVALHLFLRLKK